MFHLPGVTACAARVLSPGGDLLDLFERLRGDPFPWLLDSALPSARLGRHSFAGSDPYLVLRAIQDTAEESLPRFLEDCQREDGSIDRRKVVVASLARPTRLVALARMAKRLSFCAHRLCSPAESVIGAKRPADGSGRRG